MDYGYLASSWCTVSMAGRADPGSSARWLPTSNRFEVSKHILRCWSVCHSRGGSRGRMQGVCPPPLEVKPSSYSLLKFVHLTSQWSHSLEVHPLLRKILHPPLHRHAKSVKSPVMHEFFCIPFSCSLIVLCSWQADQHYFNIYPLNFTTPYLQWVSHLQ